MIKKSREEIKENIKAQEELCNRIDYPNFAPTDGFCWNCNRNIYQNYEINGHNSNGYNGDIHITGCPHCNRSYCD